MTRSVKYPKTTIFKEFNTIIHIHSQISLITSHYNWHHNCKCHIDHNQNHHMEKISRIWCPTQHLIGHSELILFTSMTMKLTAPRETDKHTQTHLITHTNANPNTEKLEVNLPFRMEFPAVQGLQNVRPCYAEDVVRVCVAYVLYLFQQHTAASSAAECLSLYGSSQLPLNQSAGRGCCQLPTLHISSVLQIQMREYISPAVNQQQKVSVRSWQSSYMSTSTLILLTALRAAARMSVKS